MAKLWLFEGSSAREQQGVMLLLVQLLLSLLQQSALSMLFICGSRDPIGPIQNSSPTKLDVFYLNIRSYCTSGVVWDKYAIGKPPLNIKIWL